MEEKRMSNTVSGARVSKGGLHLGHFLGCFQPLIKRSSSVSNSIFVLNDCFNSNDQLLDMLGDIYAIRNVYGLKQLRVVLESQLQFWCGSFFDFLLHNVNLAQLNSALPKTTDGTYSGITRVSDFLFPIKQALSYYVFNADYAFFNDDNTRFVTFADELAKRINNTTNLNLKITKLITGDPTRLLGYDYKKMSKGNNNAIFLSDNDNELKQKIYKLCDNSQLFKACPNEQKKFDDGYPYIYPDFFLPFQYIKALSLDKTIDIEPYKDSTKRKGLRLLLENTIKSLIFPIREVHTSFSADELLYMLKEDMTTLKEVIEKKFFEIGVQ
jgi:tryptophanyl-tRNA synthetase